MTADLASRLAGWLATRLDADDVAVDELRQHAEGWSWQTYTFRARWTERATGQRLQRGIGVRAEPRDGLLAPYDTPGQYRLHDVVRRSSEVPMPELYWLEDDPSVLGTPFYAMQRVEGLVPVQWRENEAHVFPTEQARHDIGVQFVDILTEIHALDWASHDLGYLGVPDEGDAASAAVEHWASYYRESVLVEVPLLEYAIEWLRRNPATSGRLALCHGDYRIGNFMIRDGRIVAVFDWELAHVSDPVEDIAYSGLPLFRGRDPRLSQLLPPEEFFEMYEQRSGLRVDPEVFHFWTVCGLVKAAASHLRASRAYQDGRITDLRLAAMGHQVHYVLRHLARELGVTG